MIFSVDRIEGNIAVCENSDSDVFELPVDAFPFEIKEGSVVEKTDDGRYNLCKTEEETRRKNILNLMDDIFS